MSIIFGSARSNENGKITGGKAGDQKQVSSTNDTKGEVSMQAFYVHALGWLVFNWINIIFAEAAALQMKYACNNANIGYCQGHKTSLMTYVKVNGIKSLDKVFVACETDCSTLVRVIIYIVTGIDIGDITTATEAARLKASGLFEASYAYTSQDKTPVYNGSILVTKTKGHTGIIVSGNARKSTTAGSAKTSTEYYAKYTGSSSSIVDALAAVGVIDTSKSHRTKIAAANGISGYTGTSVQNSSLLKLLKSGKLVKA